ncbi:unnamed protein product [Caenorhabditis bovis]|uniref:Uncharacterized protein n=1 Tax=Caenorhabditis bovis TaxID=2654633 RepID=A0A8S1FGJ7_9PELO|nr:unnamed protein product [Caenorhabditis bovis]
MDLSNVQTANKVSGKQKDMEKQTDSLSTNGKKVSSSDSNAEMKKGVGKELPSAASNTASTALAATSVHDGATSQNTSALSKNKKKKLKKQMAKKNSEALPGIFQPPVMMDTSQEFTEEQQVAVLMSFIKDSPLALAKDLIDILVTKLNPEDFPEETQAARLKTSGDPNSSVGVVELVIKPKDKIKNPESKEEENKGPLNNIPLSQMSNSDICLSSSSLASWDYSSDTDYDEMNESMKKHAARASTKSSEHGTSTSEGVRADDRATSPTVMRAVSRLIAGLNAQLIDRHREAEARERGIPVNEGDNAESNSARLFYKRRFNEFKKFMKMRKYIDTHHDRLERAFKMMMDNADYSRPDHLEKMKFSCFVLSKAAARYHYAMKSDDKHFRRQMLQASCETLCIGEKFVKSFFGPQRSVSAK